MDFSGISTKLLKRVVEDNDESYSCGGLGCADDGCPFAGVLCDEYSESEQYKLFKQELERRLKMEQPELKAGMVFEISDHSDNTKCLYLYIKDTYSVSLDSQYYVDITCLVRDCFISRVYERTIDRSFEFIKDNLNLIWSKKSPNQEKIEEIESTIEELKKQVKELKDEN